MSGVSNDPIRGTISFYDKTCHLAGRQDSVRNGRIGGIDHAPVGKRIECGDFVLEPNDYLCSFTITLQNQNIPLKYINLPKRLFSEKRDEISLKYDGISYELIKGPSRIGNRNYTFNALMKELNPCSYACDDDAPLDYSVIVRGGTSYYLSPECKQIYPGVKVDPQNGKLFSETKIEPLAVEKTTCQRTGLEMNKPSAAQPHTMHEERIRVISSIQNSVEKMRVLSNSEKEDGIKFTLSVPEDPNLEILLDGQDLYVSMRPSSSLQKIVYPLQEGETQPKEETVPPLYSSGFYHKHFEGIPDENMISAEFDKELGTLKITVPYKNKIQTSDKEKTFIAETSDVSAVKVETNDQTPSFVEACINIDVGFGNRLGIREESNWDETIFFDCTTQGWEGKIPLSKTFKFVLVCSNGDLLWEKGGNRFLENGSLNKLVLTSQNIRF